MIKFTSINSDNTNKEALKLYYQSQGNSIPKKDILSF